ncbi:MAG: MIP/aquaporin family protein, partial [Planctomycetota bacterium]
PTLLPRLAAEAAGTFLLVFLGLGILHSSIFGDTRAGPGTIAAVWGTGVALAIYATAGVSGAHLNPAMTAAFALFGGFRKREVLPYWVAQTVGAFAAAAALHAIFAPHVAAFEAARGISRGDPASVLSAMAYGEYFPNPTGPPVPLGEAGAFAVEGLATAILSFVVFAVTERSNASGPGRALAPAAIGLAVAALISVVGPLTQACFNPARDFGPRVFAWLAGWGSVAIPGPRGGFLTVYVLAPIAGAVVGAGLFHRLLRPRYATLP